VGCCEHYNDRSGFIKGGGVSRPAKRLSPLHGGIFSVYLVIY